MDAHDRIPGFRFLFSAEVAVRTHTVGETVLMECRPARLYLNRSTNYIHAVEAYADGDRHMIRTVFDEDKHHLGVDEIVCAPRSSEWIGLVSTGQSLVFISAKIRAAQEARENGLYWLPEDDTYAVAAQTSEPDGGLEDF